MASTTMLKTWRKRRSKATSGTSSAPQPVVEQKPDWLRVWLPRLAVPFGTSLLLWMSFFPLSWGFLAWGALVPLLCLLRRDTSGKRLFWLSYLAGFAFFLPILQWMRVADWRMNFAWGLLAVYLSFYFPIAMLLLRRIERGRLLPIWLSLPVVWVGLEYVRSVALTGFAWYYLAHTQHDYLLLIQVSDFGGAYLVSFLVAAVNGLLFDALYRWPGFRAFFRLHEPAPSPRWARGYWLPVTLGGIFIGAGLLATIWYGFERLSQDKFLDGPRVALLQPNIPQDVRNLGFEKFRQMSDKQYQRLKFLSYDRGRRTPELMADLVVWPETSYPSATWAEDNPNLPTHELPEWYIWQVELLRKVELPGLLKESPTHHLLGINSTIFGDDGTKYEYNSAVLLDPKGKKLERYDKIHRVPFGEFVPFRDELPFLKIIAPYDHDYSIQAGTRSTRMYLEDRKSGAMFRFGVLICFEDTDPALARQYGRDHEDGPPVDFIVNMSNDGWFKGTAEHEEHLAISRFRAIENRRAVVRSVNMGISGVIDSNGRVRKPTETPLRNQTELKEIYKFHSKLWVVGGPNGKFTDLPVSEWASFKEVDGVIHAIVPIDDRTSYYALLGDWVPALCGITLAVLLTVTFLRRGRPLATASMT